jgi:hypothetical protein
LLGQRRLPSSVHPFISKRELWVTFYESPHAINSFLKDTFLEKRKPFSKVPTFRSAHINLGNSASSSKGQRDTLQTSFLIPTAIKAARDINEVEYDRGTYTDPYANAICISILYDV